MCVRESRLVKHNLHLNTEKYQSEHEDKIKSFLHWVLSSDEFSKVSKESFRQSGRRVQAKLLCDIKEGQKLDSTSVPDVSCLLHL